MAPRDETGRVLFAQPLLGVHDGLIVDLFAGGGGASAGIEQATGRQVDIAINHDEDAIQMHEANLIKLKGTGTANSVDAPLDTIAAQGTHHGIAAAFLDKANGGFYQGEGRSIDEPLATILTESRGHNGLIAAHIQRDFGASIGARVEEPLGTVTGSGGGKAALVASFLAKYFGSATGQKLDEPLHTVTSQDRFGLVTVDVAGEPWYVDDICMRMLTARELFLCQGFRPGYIIDHGADGRTFTETQKVHFCGNSVPPVFLEAIAKCNAPHLICRPELQPDARPNRREVARAA